MKNLFVSLTALLVGTGVFAQSFPLVQTADDVIVSDFENLVLEPESYWNGADGSGGFTSGLVQFNNSYNADWGTWAGWAYSNTSDVTTPGFMNQFSTIAGSGFDTLSSGGGNYGVGYISSDWAAFQPIPLPVAFSDSLPHRVQGLYVTNSTYAALSMENGDDFAKKFGGETGNDPDFLKLFIWGKKDGNETDTVEFYLADFRFEDNTQDYIVKTWQWVELSSLGKIDTLLFSISSSDIGDWGMNTPLYFNIDNLTIEPDLGPIVTNPIANVQGFENDENITIPLENVFSDPDNEDVTFTYEIEYNSMGNVSSVSIDDNTNLTVDFLEPGQTTISIKATSYGKSVCNKFCIGVVPVISGDFIVSDFENLILEEESFWDGSDGSGGFTSGLVQFGNSYNEHNEGWDNWAYSNISGEYSGWFKKRFKPITGTGFDPEGSGGNNYGIAHVPIDWETFQPIPFATSFNDGSAHNVKGLYITNNMYATLLETGSDQVKKFGGETGNDPDFFKLLIWGKKNGAETDTIEFYLADFRFEDNTRDYIVKTWQWVELSTLGKIDTLMFSMASSDNGDDGTITYLYFNVDNIYVSPDAAPVTVNPIADITATENDDETTISLMDVFTDEDDEDTAITKTVMSNSNEGLVSANITGNDLTLSYTAGQSGDAVIEIEATSNGKTVSTAFTVTVIPASNTEILVTTEVIAYPNPSNGIFRIKADSNNPYSIKIYTVTGSLVYTNRQYFNTNKIDISNQPHGLYYLDIETKNERITKPILKNK
jgi:hypothetical protein